jgi:hypothetical protein
MMHIYETAEKSPQQDHDDSFDNQIRKQWLISTI